MSSRNRHLNPQERAAACCLSVALNAAEEAVAGGERSGAALVAIASAAIARQPLARIEYAFVADPDTLSAVTTVDERALVALAVWVGSTRLIDNRLLTVPAIKTERRSA
jgi:pantoate--beta-alanine ligase